MVIGDVNGKLSEVFGKLASLQTKQNFIFAIIAGNLFADPETATDSDKQDLVKLLQGDIKIPLPTYFAVGRTALPPAVSEKIASSLGEVCPNLAILGQTVSIKTTDGFRIVAMGPSEPVVDGSTASKEITLTGTDTDTDILLTCDWPAKVRDGAQAQYMGETPIGAQSISDLCTTLRPRYHFSTSASFYEREPFFHTGPSPRSITRFLSLAPFGNECKQKWIYAFSLEPSAPPPKAMPQGITASPFTAPRKRKLESQETDYQRFAGANGNGDGGCKFNPMMPYSLETHLIAVC